MCPEGFFSWARRASKASVLRGGALHERCTEQPRAVRELMTVQRLAQWGLDRLG
jgi:hypothetical protein